MNQLTPITASRSPALIAAAGANASYRFLEFFTAKIRNPHTRRAYARAAVVYSKGWGRLTEIKCFPSRRLRRQK